MPHSIRHDCPCGSVPSCRQLSASVQPVGHTADPSVVASRSHVGLEAAVKTQESAVGQLPDKADDTKAAMAAQSVLLSPSVSVV